MRRRAALMANVLASEERIRDILGIEAEIAPKELPLQTRLEANLSRLHELENVRSAPHCTGSRLLVFLPVFGFRQSSGSLS